MTEKSFGELLRELRKEKRLTQREVARRVGIDVTYLSKIENNKLPPPAQDKLKKMARILEVDEDFLITEAGKVPDDLAELIPKGSKEIPNLLREGKDLKDEEWRKVRSFIKKIKSDAEGGSE